MLYHAEKHFDRRILDDCNAYVCTSESAADWIRPFSRTTVTWRCRDIFVVYVLCCVNFCLKSPRWPCVRGGEHNGGLEDHGLYGGVSRRAFVLGVSQPPSATRRVGYLGEEGSTATQG